MNKNFKDKSITYSFYINSLLEKLEKYIKFNEINLNASLIIEIYSLMLKFHNAELTLNINKILKKEEYIKFERGFYCFLFASHPGRIPGLFHDAK